jgi:HSP20 family molecular chaperone IbpA
MNKKDKKDIDDFPKGFNEEFRSVRFYSNINGIEKEYGYDYNRDKEGKEEYREIGEIPEEYGKEFFDRISNLQKSFNWNDDIFNKSLRRFADIFPSLGQLVGEVSLPKPSIFVGEQALPEKQAGQQDYQVAYDLQIDKDAKELYLIVELPGFSKEDVKLKIVKQKLHLSADNLKKQIDTKIPIPHLIDRESKISASMKHGILEVKLKLLESDNGNGTDIPIA